MESGKTSLLNYIKDEQLIDDKWYDCIRYELDKHIYYYGSHFKRPIEAVQTDKVEKIKYQLKASIAKIKGRSSTKAIDRSKPVIISNAYFNFNEELSATGINVIQPPWVANLNSWKYYDASLISLCIKIKHLFEFAPFNFLVSKEFINLLEDFSNRFNAFIVREKIAALIVPNDESFFENTSIKIFRKLGLTSFIFLHGLPSRYNIIDENRSDYLVVWGKKLKDIYIKNGFDEHKIYVSGHPLYRSFDNKKLQFSLSDILILTKTIAGSPHSDGVILSDRGNLIVYLLSLQKVLQKFGVKQVRLRPHPSEDAEWYIKFLDKNFFAPDTKSLNSSLKQATLVIGPVSSVFLETLFFNINYLVYEPCYNSETILNTVVVPPFDGSDKRIPVAYSEEELSEFLKEKKCADTNILPDYFQTPFDAGFIKQLIK